MNAKKFISKTVKKLDESSFEQLRERIIGKYVETVFLDKDQLSKKMFLEKLHDYFEKVMIKNDDKEFDDLLQEYLSAWDRIVEKGISESSSRAGKYYAYASGFKNTNKLTIESVVDFSRIMMCLYMAVISSEKKETDNFDLSVDALELDRILAGMREEESSGFLWIGKGAMFDTKDLFSIDSVVFVITVIMYYRVKYFKTVEE